MEFKQNFSRDIRWHGKIVAEENVTDCFSDLVERDIKGFKVVGFDINIFQGDIILGRLHLKKGQNTRVKYLDLKEDISLKDLFFKFQNAKIIMKIGYRI